jgi:C-terminal processing protease CtpA/Prc
MSSNESFVLMMRQAKDCTVVGQKTYGSSGNPKAHELPNGVTIFLPSWQDLRPDGTCFEGEGLAPDVEVAAEPKDFEEKDPILEKALEILRGKMKKG